MKIIKSDKWAGLSMLVINIIEVILLSKAVEKNISKYYIPFLIIWFGEYVLLSMYLSITRKISYNYASSIAGLIFTVMTYSIWNIVAILVE